MLLGATLMGAAEGKVAGEWTRQGQGQTVDKVRARMPVSRAVAGCDQCRTHFMCPGGKPDPDRRGEQGYLTSPQARVWNKRGHRP